MIGAMKRSRHLLNPNKDQSQSNLQPSIMCCKSFLFKPKLKKLHTDLSWFHNLPFICREPSRGNSPPLYYLLCAYLYTISAPVISIPPRLLFCLLLPLPLPTGRQYPKISSRTVSGKQTLCNGDNHV